MKPADSPVLEHTTERRIATTASIDLKTLRTVQVTFSRSYTFIRSLGAGAFRQADLYKHSATNICVVVKTVNLPSRESETGTPIEAVIMSGLPSHPRLAGILGCLPHTAPAFGVFGGSDLGPEECDAKIMIEYCDYGTVSLFIRRLRRASDMTLLAGAWHVLGQVAEGLGLLHWRGCTEACDVKARRAVLHCDIRAQNILMRKTEGMLFNDCVIADFGLSELYPDDPEGEPVVPDACTDAMQLGRMIARMIEGRLQEHKEGESPLTEPAAVCTLPDTSQWSGAELARQSICLLCKCVGTLFQCEGVRIPLEYLERVVPLAERMVLVLAKDREFDHTAADRDDAEAYENKETSV